MVGLVRQPIDNNGNIVISTNTARIFPDLIPTVISYGVLKGPIGIYVVERLT